MPTKIEWTDETLNPTTGCDRVSPGCDNCYALTMAKRLKAMGSAHYQTDGDPRTSGPGFGLAVHEDVLPLPMRWKRPRRVFVNSMSDLFHKDVPEEFICKAWTVMRKTPEHTYQILTKRPQRMVDVVSRIAWRSPTADERAEGLTGYQAYMGAPGSVPLPNVWLGTSIELDRYTFRAEHLRNTPAAVRWISAEPLLGPLPSLDLTGIDWLVAGGESGHAARPMHPGWVRDLRDRCTFHTRECTNGDLCAKQHRDAVDADGIGRHPEPIPFLFKQWGNWLPYRDAVGTLGMDDPAMVRAQREVASTKLTTITSVDPMEAMIRVSKKAAGRMLDGREWNEYPE